MNTIKSALKKFWRGLKNVFGFSSVETVETENAEIIDKCDCEKTGSNCDDPNCDCHCQCETHHDENCKCDCHNKDIEEAKKELNPIVEDENQMTIDGIIEEDKQTEEVPVKVYYSDDTVTREVLIAELRKNGVTGISRLKKTELLAKFHEMNLKFPEVN